MGKKQKKRMEEQKRDVTREDSGPFLYRAGTGNYLTIAAAVALQFTIILLPLVGPAGAVTPHAAQNALSWVGLALVALLLSGLAFYSKWQRHRRDGSPVPLWSVGLCLVSSILLIAFFSGALRV